MIDNTNYLLLFFTFLITFIVKDFYDIIIRPHIIILFKNYYKAYKHITNKTKEKIKEKIDER